jgi:hypothetical protein
MNSRLNKSSGKQDPLGDMGMATLFRALSPDDEQINHDRIAKNRRGKSSLCVLQVSDEERSRARHVHRGTQIHFRPSRSKPITTTSPAKKAITWRSRSGSSRRS